MENSNTYYSVMDVTPTSEDWIPGYLPVANSLVAKHGGKYLSRTPNHQQVEGNSDPVGLRVIIQWPSKDAAMAWMNDTEYAPHFAARTQGSISNHYLIEGKDEFG